MEEVPAAVHESRVSDCLATPLALASSWKSKGAARRIVKDKGSGLIKPIETDRKELISAKNWKILKSAQFELARCGVGLKLSEKSKNQSLTPSNATEKSCLRLIPKVAKLLVRISSSESWFKTRGTLAVHCVRFLPVLY